MYDIVESQIYQDEIGKAEFRIVKSEKYNSNSENKLINEIKIKLGNDFIYNIKYLKKIKRTNNGKIKFVINNIKI